MASGGFVDVAQVLVRESQAEIPDDIFDAAFAASMHDSDGEDPFEPQPKRFMQTEHQKRMQKRDLEIRKVAWTIRKMRKQYEAQQQRMASTIGKMREHYEAQQQRLARQKLPPSPLERMPSDLVLKMMQHTDLRDLRNLISSSAINRNIFEANKKAVLRGMEIEQFPEWAWLFGNSKQRTPAQSQNLKDGIVSEGLFYKPKQYGSIVEGWILKLVQKVDNNEFTGVGYIKFLRFMQNRLDADIKSTESFTDFKIARRTAICLRSLGFFRTEMVDEALQWIDLPWEARSQRIREQPASIQAEIRSVLKFAIETIYHSVQDSVKGWILSSYYSDPGKHGKPQEIKKWISKLVTGLSLDVVIPKWRRGSRRSSSFVWQSWDLVIEYDLLELFNEHDEGDENVIQKVEHGVEFGNSVGLDLERLLDGTLAGACLDVVRSDGDGEFSLHGVVVEEADVPFF